MDTLIGQTLGPYRVLEQVGAGGMATVYKAYQSSMDRYVALKVLPPHLANEPTFRARFEREARAIARLEHRYILPVYDFGQENGIHYLVMRYIDAGTLGDLIASGTLTMERAIQIVSQVAEALAYAHRHGIIHCDVKPANVLIGNDGGALLTDFGIAKLYEETLQITGENTRAGTPLYMAPEQVQGQQLDGRTDIYALGVVLYQTLTGEPPFMAETPLAVALMHIHNPLRPPRQLNPAIPEALERVILRAMAKSPTDRFQTADELAAALDVQPVPPPVPKPLPPTPLRTRLVLGATVAAALLAAVLLIPRLIDPNPPPPPPDCGLSLSEPNPTITAVPDEQLDRLFTRNDDGWTGGGRAPSIHLPDGRTVWVFSQAYLGGLNPDRSRRADSGSVSNVMLVQDGDQLLLRHGGTPDAPAALVTLPGGLDWYEFGTGVVEANKLHVLAGKYRRNGPGFLDVERYGTDIATFALPDLTLESVTSISAGNVVSATYGTAISQEDDYTYIYGVEHQGGFDFVTYLARAPQGNLRGQWEFYTDTGWSTAPDAATPVFTKAAESVVRFGDRYLLLTTGFDKQIIAYQACAPFGPWHNPLHLYTAPERYPTTDDKMYAGAALVHPQFSTRDDELVISYHLNFLFQPPEYYLSTADIGRPRFYRVRISR